MTAETLLATLRSTLPAGVVVTDEDLLESYRHDQTPWAEAGQPAAVVLANSTADVSATLQAASAHRVPVVPRGAGSGLSGGAAAIDGCVVLSLERMSAIEEIHPADQIATVQPGVINADVSRAAAEHGLWYAPDPASRDFSTIGGNVATNAGGLCCVKYGVTRDHVLGLEVVLADGTCVRTGRKTVKGVAGLDLTGLMVGSEGTLGIVTSVTLRLRPTPRPPATVVAYFDGLRIAGAAASAVLARGVVPSLAELIDRPTMDAIEAWKRLELDPDAEALLLFQTDAADATRQAELETITECCSDAGATYVAHTDDHRESEQLLTARRLAYPALERIGDTLLDDVAVPRSLIPELLEAIHRIAERRAVTIGTFGHIGDGNLHPTIVSERGNPDARESAQQAFDDILAVTLELGGTLTGEHGVGSLKNRYLRRELGPALLDVHRRLKDALDPQGILNPGRGLGL